MDVRVRLLNVLLDRIAATYGLRPIATNGVAWSVGLSVGLSVYNDRQLCKKRLNQSRCSLR